MGTTARTDEETKALNKRMETAGWGLFLIMMGGMWLVPQAIVPQGLWSIGVGLILLGLNAARRYYGIPMSTGTLILGGLALVTGLGEIVGIKNLPILEVLIIAAGANMIWKAVQKRE